MPRPVQLYDFTAFSRRTPTAQPPGDRLDAQFREHADAIAEIQQALTKLDRPIGAERLDPKLVAGLTAELTARFQARLDDAGAAAQSARISADAAAREAEAARTVAASTLVEAQAAVAEAQARFQARLLELNQVDATPREPTLPTPSLYVGAGGPYAGDDKGATATSADYAQVSIDWAEHMPDTIPPNTLTVTNVSGDHWSSRWWASRAASIVSTITGGIGAIPGTQGVFCEALTVTAGGIPNLSKTPAGPVLLVMNGAAFLPVGAQPPFAVAGKTITWLSPIYALFPGTEISVWYPYAP